MASPIQASTYEEFTITSADGSKVVSLIGGIIKFQYFENLLSPNITAILEIFNTGNTIDGQGLYNGLPVRGGERVYFKIKTPIEANAEGEEQLELVLYVNKITGVVANKARESLTLHLCSREAITNEQTRVTRKFYGQTIDQSVEQIIKLTDPLKLTEFEKCENSYNFIGNLRKPFTVISWLQSKAIPVGATSKSAGFFFWQTRKGFHFKSVDTLIKDGIEGDVKDEKTKQTKLPSFYYSETYDNSLEDAFASSTKILSFSVLNDNNILDDLNSGVQSTYRIFFNPVSFEFTEPQNSMFKERPANTLGEAYEPPKIADPENIPGVYMASRIISEVYDVGTLDVGVSTQINYNQIDSTSQAITRYGMLFNTNVKLSIPCMTNLCAGDAIMLYFPKTTDAEPEVNDRMSGIYIIKELTHVFLPQNSFTSLRVVKDTHGLYPQS